MIAQGRPLPRAAVKRGQKPETKTKTTADQMKPDTTDNRPEAEKAADAINARDILARGKGKLRVLDGARIALAFQRHFIHRKSLGSLAYPFGEQAEQALADEIAKLLPSRGPVTVAELCALFPSLRCYAENAIGPSAAAWVAKMTRDNSQGSGAAWAAEFLGSCFPSTRETVCAFNLAAALAAWDSEHRAAFAQAAAMIATRGI